MLLDDPTGIGHSNEILKLIDVKADTAVLVDYRGISVPQAGDEAPVNLTGFSPLLRRMK